jgi:hypothetical protein
MHAELLPPFQTLHSCNCLYAGICPQMLAGYVANAYTDCAHPFHLYDKAGTPKSFEPGEYPDITEDFPLGQTNGLSMLDLKPGYGATLYSETNFGGSSVDLTSSALCLLDEGLDNAVGSLKIYKL